MRALVMIGVIAATAPAGADSKTKELAVGYEKEAAACRTRSDGLLKATTGTEALVGEGKKEYEADLGTLRASLAQVQAYCGELAATLALLNADANASYRSLERRLDEADNRIRKLRQNTKKVLEDVAPVIGRMVPVINARVGGTAPSVKRAPIKFPSGRAIDAPALAGTYKVWGSAAVDTVEYTEGKAVATINVRAIANSTCDAQKKAVTSKLDVAPTEATRPLELAWYVASANDKRRLRVACRAGKDGSAVVATIDDPILAAPAAWPELEPVMILMLVAHKE